MYLTLALHMCVKEQGGTFAKGEGNQLLCIDADGSLEDEQSCGDPTTLQALLQRLLMLAATHMCCGGYVCQAIWFFFRNQRE